jgi:transcription antitermination factor NusG
MSVTQRGGAVSNLYQVLDASPDVTRSWVASEDKPWFAIQTRPRHEKSVTAGLQEKGIKVFLPLLSENHRWSDRCRVVDVPLFPSYVFIQTADTPATRILVLRTLGVVQFVGVRGAGIPIPDEQIESVRIVLEHGIRFTPFPYLNVGQRVRIRGGSLEGVQGILLGMNGDQSLIISVELIQRSLAIRVAGYQVEPA